MMWSFPPLIILTDYITSGTTPRYLLYGQFPKIAISYPATSATTPQASLESPWYSLYLPRLPLVISRPPLVFPSVALEIWYSVGFHKAPLGIP